MGSGSSRFTESDTDKTFLRGDSSTVLSSCGSESSDRNKRPKVNEAPVTASKGSWLRLFPNESERDSIVWLYHAMFLSSIVTVYCMLFSLHKNKGEKGMLQARLSCQAKQTNEGEATGAVRRLA